MYLRCLSVAKQALLLLQLLDLVLIRSLRDEVVNVTQVAVGRDLKARVLLANTVTTAQLIVRTDGRGGRPSLVAVHVDSRGVVLLRRRRH